MSSLTVLQSKESIVFASDTAISMSHSDKVFRVGNESKIHEFSDFILFASGKMWLKNILINNIGTNPSIDDIENVLRNDILPISEYYSLEVIIGMKDKSKIIFFSSTDDFIRNESLPENNIKLYTAGYKTSEFADGFLENYKTNNVYKALLTTYKELSDEKVGGNLEIYTISNEVTLKKVNIDTIPTTEYIDIYKSLNLVHANRVVGKMLIGEKLVLEDSEGVWETHGSTTVIYDRNRRPSMWIGQLEPNCFGIRMDNQKHRINLSTCDGFKISKYNGSSLEDVMYADLEGNIWSKYWTHDTTNIKDSQGYFDLKDNQIVIKDGNREVMRMGYIPSGTFGGCTISSDWGVALVGTNGSNIYMTRNRGFAIDVNCVNKFQVLTNGNIFAQDIEANNLMIKSAKIGNNININEANGIVITNGSNRIIMNGTDGFKIENNGTPIFYVGNDGKLYAKNFYTLNEDGTTVTDLDGSFISDLTVNRLKTLSTSNRVNYVHIEDNYIKFNTESQTKLNIAFNGTSTSAYPIITWGSGDTSGNSIAYQYKTTTTFATEYVATDGGRRSIELTDLNNGGIIFTSPYGVQFYLSGSLIEINPTGIYSNGSQALAF